MAESSLEFVGVVRVTGKLEFKDKETNEDVAMLQVAFVGGSANIKMRPMELAKYPNEGLIQIRGGLSFGKSGIKLNGITKFQSVDANGAPLAGAPAGAR